MIEVEITADERLLRDTAAKFVEAEYPLQTVRQLVGTTSGIPDGYLRQIGDLGWLGLLVPDDGEGGIGESGITYAAIIAEERGRGVQPGPFVATNVVIAAIGRSGSAQQRAEILPALVSGEQSASWAVTDLSGVFAPSTSVRCRAVGGGYVLFGEAIVQDGDSVDWLLVTAGSDAGLSQFLVPRNAATEVAPRESHDVTLRFSTVTFEDVEVDASCLVGPVGGGADDVEQQLQLAALLVAAETVGAMSALFEMARQYALDRFAFGRPIGSFQSLKHQLADMSLSLEAARAVTANAVEALEAGSPDAGEVTSIAKAWTGDVGIDLAQGCLQVFGGIGYTWEHDCHLYLRRITMNGLLYGAPDWHRERICQIHGL
jgi:alkylation response protein AidB-like acyl-CoA dehydrogenase